MLCLKLITKAEFSRVLPCHVAVSTCNLVSKSTRKVTVGSWPCGKLIWWELTSWEDNWWEVTSWEVDLVGLYLVGVDFVRVDFVGVNLVGGYQLEQQETLSVQYQGSDWHDTICIISTTKLWKCSSPLHLFSQLRRSACWHVTFFKMTQALKLWVSCVWSVCCRCCIVLVAYYTVVLGSVTAACCSQAVC